MENRPAFYRSPSFILKTLLLMGGSGFALFLVMFLATGVHWGSKALQGLQRWTQWQTQPAQLKIETLVIQQIRGVSELTTTVFAMETVVPTSQARQWGNFEIGRTELLYISYGEVRAGIDLSLMTPEAIQQTGDRLVLTLPAPQILDQKIDVNRSRIYDYDRGFLNLGPDTAPQLQAAAQRQSLNKIVAAACERGILQEANDRAEMALKNLLNHPAIPPVTLRTTLPDACGGQTINAAADPN